MLETIQKRRSIRSFKDTPIKKEDLQKIKEAIQCAPTWKNKQCFEVISIDNQELQSKIGELVKYNPSECAYTKASHLFVFIANPERSGNRDSKPYYMCDSAIAIDHAMLCATSLGIGTCFVGIFPEEELKQLLSIPQEYRIVALLPLGYPNEEPAPRPRRELNQIFHQNIY